MAGVEHTEIFNCTPEQFFKIITDYPNYPQFMNEVSKCTVVHEEGNKKLVEFELDLVKKFKYKLWLTEEPNKKLSWVFDSGDMLKSNNGSWELEEEAEKTRVTYKVEVKAKMFIPGPIIKTITSVNLPSMMSSVHKRVSDLYGK